jgi:HK97 family phage portal protein
MNIFSWVSQKLKLTDGKTWSAYFGNDAWAGEKVTLDSAMQTGAFHGCVKLYAQTISTLPIGLWEKQPGGRKSVDDHPLQRLVRDEPNADQDAAEYWESKIAWLTATGNAISEKVFDTNNPNTRRLVALDLLNPIWTAIERRNDGAKVYHYRAPGKAERTLTEDRIFHLRGMSFGADVGMSMLEAARQSISTSRATERAASSHFANGMRPSGWLVYKGGSLEPDQRELAKQNLINPMIGAENAGKIGILEGEFDYKQMTIEPEAAQLLESRRFSVEDICRWFGVPPILLAHAAQGQTMWGCISSGTKILTNSGPVNIENVTVGTMVWTLDGDKMVQRPVLRSAKTGIEPVLSIRTRTRTVRATANHKFLARRKHAAPHTGAGGYRAVEWRNEWVRADELTDSDYLLLAHDLLTSDTRVAPNDRLLTEDFMAFCGLYLAEGSMNDRHVTIARHKDAGYMNAYRDTMRAEFSRSTARLVVNGGLAPVHLMETDRATTFSSKAAVDELTELGFAGTAHTKRIPGWVFDLSRPLQLAFLRGYLDGDGHVNKSGWITWTSVNRDLIEDVRALCMIAGIPVGKACGYPITKWFDGREREEPGTVWQAWSFSVEHNKKIGSHDPRYLERWASCQDFPRIGRFSPDYAGRGGSRESRPGTSFGIQGAALERVVSIDRGSLAEPVFDLEIEGTHNFIADGVVVHNSGIEQIVLGWYVLQLRPRMVRLERAMKRQLMSPGDKQKLYFEFNAEGLLRGDSAARAEFYWKMLQVGAMTPNSICDKENLPRWVGGDRHYVNTTLAPVDEEGLMIKQNPAQPPDPNQQQQDQPPAQPQRRLEVVK